MRVEIELNGNKEIEELIRTLPKDGKAASGMAVKAALAAIETGVVRGMAHITGGGMYGNVIRVIPKHLDINVDFGSWKRPKVFDLVQSAGIDEEEMRKVFNLGIGFVFIIDPKDLKTLEEALEKLGEHPTVIGEVIKCSSPRE